jgi:hypothetical protein
VAAGFFGTLAVIAWLGTLLSLLFRTMVSFDAGNALRGWLFGLGAVLFVATTVAISSTLLDDPAGKGLCRAGYQQWASGSRRRTKVWICTQWDAEAEPPR